MTIKLLDKPKILDVPDVPDKPPTEAQALLNDQRPKVRLPGDNHVLSDTAAEVGELLKDKDIFRRGSMAFHAPKTDREFVPTFESWKAMGVRVDKTLGRFEGPISIPR